MKSIIFRNKGEIDIRAFTSFGVNAKESGNAIGYFGTGLKYAIAVLLREGCHISVGSGEKLIEFALSPSNFRGKEFEFISMRIDDAEPTELGYTTELGKNWEMWCAYRELACNCMDEGGDAYEEDTMLTPLEAGMTHIRISGEKFIEAHHNRGEALLETTPLAVMPRLEVHYGCRPHLFYKGVRVAQVEACLFTYNVLSGMKLTEDRTLTSLYDFKTVIAKSLLTDTNDTQLLKAVLLAEDDYIEHHLDFDWESVVPSETFLEVVGKLVEDKLVDINQTAVAAWKRVTKKSSVPLAVELTRVQIGTLAKAIAFCHKLGFPVDGYTIRVVEELGHGILGLATEGMILIAERTMHQGTKQLVATLIEEYLHLKHGYEDCSRELQTYLFDRVVSLGEELQGEPL